ncbi:MAG: hypothetical protein AAGA57_10145 [Planctomycetota bacterium]
MKRASRLIALFVLAAGPFACGPTAYFNVPSDEGDWFALNSANAGTARAVSEVALARVVADSGAPSPFEYLLPEGAAIQTYRKAGAALGPSALVPSEQSPAGTPLFAVRSVRVRGTEAQVEVIRPSGVFDWELVDVDLVWNLCDGWRVDLARPRRVQVEAPNRSTFIEDAAAETQPAGDPT